MKLLFLIPLLFIFGCAITAHVKDGKAHLTGYGAEKVEYYPDGKIKSLSKHPPFEMPKLEYDN